MNLTPAGVLETMTEHLWVLELDDSRGHTTCLCTGDMSWMEKGKESWSWQYQVEMLGEKSERRATVIQESPWTEPKNLTFFVFFLWCWGSNPGCCTWEASIPSPSLTPPPPPPALLLSFILHIHAYVLYIKGGGYCFYDGFFFYIFKA
jgi:hypothetical protein